jgi:hypothetical protein
MGDVAANGDRVSKIQYEPYGRQMHQFIVQNVRGDDGDAQCHMGQIVATIHEMDGRSGFAGQHGI